MGDDAGEKQAGAEAEMVKARGSVILLGDSSQHPC